MESSITGKRKKKTKTNTTTQVSKVLEPLWKKKTEKGQKQRTMF